MADRPQVSDRAAHRFNNGLRYGDADHPRQWHLTPAYVLEPVADDLGGHIGLDPCTFQDNPTQAFVYFTAQEDGLAQSWNGVPSVYVNPPYGKAREPWAEKCIEAGRRGQRVILLIPAATDTRIFQRAVSTSTAVVFVRGRVKFGSRRGNGAQHAASHPSALIGWNTSLDACSRLGIRLARAVPDATLTAGETGAVTPPTDESAAAFRAARPSAPAVSVSRRKGTA